MIPTRAAIILAAAFLGGFLGTFSIKAPLWQYYLTFLPALAVLGSLGIVRIVRLATVRSVALGWAASVVLLVVCIGPPTRSLAGIHRMGWRSTF
ncbi:MAG: hypothetical protein R3E12_11460 [Candidatus Eisenbacteria bacterium]